MDEPGQIKVCGKVLFSYLFAIYVLLDLDVSPFGFLLHAQLPTRQESTRAPLEIAILPILPQANSYRHFNKYESSSSLLCLWIQCRLEIKAFGSDDIFEGPEIP